MAAGAKKSDGKRKLTIQQQHFIVSRLACYTQIKDVQTEFEEEFGFPVDRNLVGRYDPTKRYNDRLGQKLVDLFHTTRKNYEDGLLAMHPISKRVYRVDKLGKMFERAYEKGNHPLAAQFLKQAADEVEEIQDRKRKAKRWGQQDNVPPDQADEFDGSEVESESLREILADALGKALSLPGSNTVQ